MADRIAASINRTHAIVDEPVRRSESFVCHHPRSQDDTTFDGSACSNPQEDQLDIHKAIRSQAKSCKRSFKTV